jgi:hypothetical protein
MRATTASAFLCQCAKPGRVRKHGTKSTEDYNRAAWYPEHSYCICLRLFQGRDYVPECVLQYASSDSHRSLVRLDTVDSGSINYVDYLLEIYSPYFTVSRFYTYCLHHYSDQPNWKG